MLFQTTQAHEQLRAKIRAFAEEEVKPIAFSLDQANEFPAEAVKKLGELGRTADGITARGLSPFRLSTLILRRNQVIVSFEQFDLIGM